MIVLSVFFLPILNLDPFANIKHIRPLTNIIKNEITNRNNIALMTDDREDYAQLLYYLKNINIKKAKWNGDIKIDDLENLEEELNNLSDNIKKDEKKEDNIFSNLFNIGKNKNDDNIPSKSVQETESKSDINLGKNTSQYNDTKSWDGYGKFNNVPLSKDIAEKPKLTHEEELREKFKYLRK